MKAPKGQTLNIAIAVVARPYVIRFHGTGQCYPLTSGDAQRLLDAYPAIAASSAAVVLQGHNSDQAYDRTTIRPATLGGGVSFVITKR